MIPIRNDEKGRIHLFSLTGLGISYFLLKSETALRSGGSGDYHSPCLRSPGGKAVALAGEEQSQPGAVPLGLYSPAPGSPQHTKVTLALSVPTPDTKIAQLRASPFLEGQAAAGAQGGRREWVLGCMSR